ncbi:hypothetical protein HZS_1149 [Henneguya salminicola]|nr:hypothetical protein HZS_1149 [Henneguya salminicola]
MNHPIGTSKKLLTLLNTSEELIIALRDIIEDSVKFSNPKMLRNSTKGLGNKVKISKTQKNPWI